jgi:hypothetical protein
MKKFGTPIGAGPGSDSENVGLLALGTPMPDGSSAFDECCADEPDDVVDEELPPPVSTWVDCRCWRVGPAGVGPEVVVLELVLDDWVEDDEDEPELEVEVWEEELDELELGGGVVVVVVVVVVDVVAVAAAVGTVVAVVVVVVVVEVVVAATTVRLTVAVESATAAARRAGASSGTAVML